MSYILDALKKSEQERGNGTIPNVQTIHSSALNYHQEKKLLWPWILIAVLVTNVFILIYFLKPETNSQPIAAEQNAITNNVLPYENNSAPAKVTELPITESNQQETVISYNYAATTEQTAPEEFKPVVGIEELPANIRQHIPNMVFSAHVYSSAPLQRSLVINDRFMEEGETISEGLTLVEITHTGAIFEFRGYRFSTSVLSGWNTH